MKIFASIIGAAIGMFIGVQADGLFGGQLSSDIDLLLCGLVSVVIVQLCFALNDTKALRAEITELKAEIKKLNKTENSENVN